MKKAAADRQANRLQLTQQTPRKLHPKAALGEKQRINLIGTAESPRGLGMASPQGLWKREWG